MSRLKTSLPESLATAVNATIADWQSGGKMQRLWQRDATLWTGSDEANWRMPRAPWPADRPARRVGAGSRRRTSPPRAGDHLFQGGDVAVEGGPRPARRRPRSS